MLELRHPDETKLFQEMIGCLIWIQAGTRQCIPYATSKLACYASNPSKKHHTAETRIWECLSGTLNLAVWYSTTGSGLQGFVDADWAGPNSSNTASTSGFVFKLANGPRPPYHGQAKGKSLFSLPSIEAEYIAMGLAT